MSKIYTRKGDRGETSLASGERVGKSDVRVEAYGTIDELNAFLGLLSTYLDGGDADLIKEIQESLFEVGASLSTKVDCKQKLPPFDDGLVERMEQWMDETSRGLPKRTGFVRPGGNRAAALSHVCRTVCRRAERTIVKLADFEVVDSRILVFVNRLSDFLFTLAQKLSHINL